MKFPLFLLAASVALPVAANDQRQLAPLPEPAQQTLRQEMLDNLIALNEIVALLAEDKLPAAGEIAETRLGRSAMGKNAALPVEARPGPQMPRAMHAVAIDGHLAASAFAEAATAGDRPLAMRRLADVTGTCVACHAAYRIR
ncbi:MAG TPA: hypothetical protein PKC12_06695 [Thiobacillaceae bacterium]|nr:hypothetical protein [Thiobacillaceae bacterium]